MSDELALIISHKSFKLIRPLTLVLLSIQIFVVIYPPYAIIVSNMKPAVKNVRVRVRKHKTDLSIIDFDLWFQGHIDQLS